MSDERTGTPQVYHVTLGRPLRVPCESGRGDLLNFILWMLTIAVGIAAALVARWALGV